LILLPCWGQEPATAPLPRPTGLRLNGLSVYNGSDWLRVLSNGPQTSASPLWLWTGGATADVAAQFGQKAQLSINYHSGYIYNQQFSVLNGFNHSLTLDFRTDPARRTVFTLSATGESGPIGDALFDPRYTLQQVQSASTIDDIASGINAGHPATILNSPIELALAGVRRRSAAATIGLTRAHSRRLTSFLHVGAAREIHTYGQEQQAVVHYPNTTIGMADAGLSYSVTRRTSINAFAGYTRSYSSAFRLAWESAGMGVQRQIGRRSFGSLQAGYLRMTGVEGGVSGRGSYTATGTLGTIKGYHTLAATFRRGVADMHGLGAQTAMAGEGAWSWAPHASAWSVGSSLGIERLTGSGVGTIEAWIWQGTATRRLSTHLQIAVAGVYLTDTGSEILGLTRRGFRISFAWRPAVPRVP